MTTRNFTKVFKDIRSNKQEIYLNLNKDSSNTTNIKKSIEDQIKYYNDSLDKLHQQILEYNKVSIEFASKEKPEKKYQMITNNIQDIRKKINNFNLAELNQSVNNNIKVALTNKLNNIIIILRKTIKDNHKRNDKLNIFSEIEYDDNEYNDYNDYDYDYKSYNDNDMLIEMKAVDHIHKETLKREQNIKKIYEDVQKLNGMFIEVHDLINEQGFILDRIEDNIYQASEHITIGNNNLNDAHNIQKSSSNICCYILVILLIFGILLILSIIMFNVNK